LHLCFVKPLPRKGPLLIQGHWTLVVAVYHSSAAACFASLVYTSPVCVQFAYRSSWAADTAMLQAQASSMLLQGAAALALLETQGKHAPHNSA
jgi:hypothetical protein